MKKLLLSLGSVAAIAAPIAAVVSCGDKDSTKIEVSIEKAKANDVNLQFDQHNYYIKSGSKKVEVIVKPEADGHKAVYGTITEKDGKEITASTNPNNLRLNDETKINPKIQSINPTAATNYVAISSEHGISYFVPNKKHLEQILVYFSKGKVTSKENAISSINDLLKGVDLVVDSLEFEPANTTGSTTTEAQISHLAIGKKANLDARNKLVEDLGKLKVAVNLAAASGAAATNPTDMNDNIPKETFSAPTEDAIKTFVAKDVHVTAKNDVTITPSFPTMPSGSPAPVITAQYVKGSNALKFTVAVGDTDAKDVADITLTLNPHP